MPQLAPRARLRGNKTRADTKIRFPELPDHPTTRASAPPLRNSAKSNNPNQDATDFGQLVKWVVLRARSITAIAVRPASLTFTRLRAELW